MIITGKPKPATMGASPKRVAVAGDWHGNAMFALHAINYAAGRGCDTIMHVGDFGWWVPGARTAQFLTAVNDELRHHRMTLYFVDGNHEYHPGLGNANTVVRDLDGLGWLAGSPWSTDEFPCIAHVPRGYRWQWFDLHFMGLGGAYSVDRDRRTLGEDYWLEETLSLAQVEYASRPGPVDIVIAHDAPSFAVIPGIKPHTEKHRLFSEYHLREGYMHRLVIDQAAEAVAPLAWFHGHYHRSYSGTVRVPFSSEQIQLHGLGADVDIVRSSDATVHKAVSANIKIFDPDIY